MSIECYYSACPFHDIHSDPDSGPYCNRLGEDKLLQCFLDTVNRDKDREQIIDHFEEVRHAEIKLIQI